MGDSVIEENPEEFTGNTATPSGGMKQAEHLLKLTGYGVYNFDMNAWGIISVYGAVGFNTYFHFDHKAGNTEFQPQMTIGAKWKY